MTMPAAAAMANTFYSRSFICMDSFNPHSNLQVDAIIFILILHRNKLWHRRDEWFARDHATSPVIPGTGVTQWPRRQSLCSLTAVSSSLLLGRCGSASFSRGLHRCLPGWEGQKCLVTAGWWQKPWSSPRPSLAVPHLGWGERPCYCQWGWKSRHPVWSPLVLWRGEGGECVSFMPGGDETPSSLCILLCRHLGRCVGVPWYSLAEGWSLVSPLGLAWHGWEWGHSFVLFFFCGFWLE